MEKKVYGYVLAAIGLFILVVGAGDFGITLPLEDWYISVIGMVFVGLGVVVVIMYGDGGSRKSKKKNKDLPVYEGDDIVAYRRD